jgi:hypothetical protein
MTTWKGLGTWVARDERGRLHYQGCLCAMLDAMPRHCTTAVCTGFTTQAEAQGLAADLERKHGFAMDTAELEIRVSLPQRRART